MTYFDHDYVSNSDLKSLRQKYDPKYQEPDNLQAIFDFGNLFENLLLLPHLVDKSKFTSEELDIATRMRNAILKDELCGKILLHPGFRRQHEFYRQDNGFGVKARCKTDGDIKSLKVVFELKGLKVKTEKAFKEAIRTFHYDQGAAWYINTTYYDAELIVAASKSDPDRPPFKMLIDRNHPYYWSGHKKASEAVRLWRQFGFE